MNSAQANNNNSWISRLNYVLCRRRLFVACCFKTQCHTRWKAANVAEPKEILNRVDAAVMHPPLVPQIILSHIRTLRIPSSSKNTTFPKIYIYIYIYIQIYVYILGRLILESVHCTTSHGWKAGPWYFVGMKAVNIIRRCLSWHFAHGCLDVWCLDSILVFSSPTGARKNTNTP